jgi:hypothetical protein
MDPTITADELEYIEVYNPTLQELDLSGWRLDGAVEFQFAPGTTLAAHEAILVVTFDPVRPQSAIRLLAFRQQYELDPSVRLVGPYGGNQPDDFGHVALLQPGTGGDPQHALFYARDQVVYDDLAPWPAGTDGQGGSLARRAADTSGLAASGWLAKAPTPGTVSFAPSPGPLLPDLVIWDDPLLGFNYFDYLDQHPATQRKIMRFSTAVKNAGSGPLTVHGGDVVDGQQQVLQVVTHADGSTSEYVAGSYVFHPTHGHVHFGDYALYRLYEVADDGGLGPQVAGGEKVSFCLIDSVPFDVALDGAPGLPIYSSCERQTQGISIGWADVYASDLDDQWIDVESVPAGRYWLETFVDPFNHLIEQDETNNVLRHQVVLGVPEYPPDSLDADRINELRLGTGDRELSSMSIHKPGDIDTFRWIAPSTGTLEVDLAFDHDQGDIDLYIWGTDLQSQVQLVSATTEEHGERASFPVIAGKSYFIVVKELSGDTNPSYSLTIDGPDIPADRFEPNDSVLQPTHLGSTSQTLSNLTIHGPNDRDFFAWTAPETATLLVDLQFNSAQGNLDLYVHDFVTNEVVSSTSNIGRELVEVEVDAGRTYVIVIRGRDGDMVNSYDLSVDLLNIPLDAYEPNDSQSQPAVWSAGDRDVSDLSIHKPFNRDYYRWQAPADGPVSVDLFFEQSEGDLDLVLWQDGQSLARSVSSTSNEGVTFEASAGRVYVIEVMGKNGATNAHYRLVVDGPSSVPDEYEPNDTLLTAIDLGEGDVEPIQANVHASFNSDFYQWTPGGSGVLILDLFFQHALGDLDVVLWADGTELAAAAGEEDNERLFMYIDAGRSYVIEVRGKEADINPSYELRIDGPELAADSLEPNDTLDSAMDLGIGDIQLEGMNIHEPDNSDFYRWTAQGSGLAAVDLLFSHEAGDLDLALWINGEEVASSASLDDDERLTFAATLGQQYIIQVRGKDGAVNSQYDLQIDSPPSVEAPRVVSLGIRQASSSALWASPIAGDDLIATIPRPNWQQIQLGFSEGVNVRAEDLQIEGVLQSSYPLSSFDYDDVAHLATWTLTSPPLPTDRLTLTLSDRLVDHSLNALDGDSHGVEFPSGNGLPGGAFVLTVDLTPGDYAPDRQLDDRDIDALGAALRDDDPLADLNDDGRSTTDDILTLVRELLGTTIGDVNLDGRFDSSDLVEMFAAGEFEDMLAGNSTWASGDLNGDGEFDSSDLIFAFQIGGYQS